MAERLSRALWKPAVLLVLGIALIVFGLNQDPRPRCGDVEMRPDMVCETTVRGRTELRTYDQLAVQAQLWRVGAPTAGGLLGAAAVIWLVHLLARGEFNSRDTDPTGPGSAVTGDATAGGVPEATGPAADLPAAPPPPPAADPTTDAPWRPEAKPRRAIQDDD